MTLAAVVYSSSSLSAIFSSYGIHRPSPAEKVVKRSSQENKFSNIKKKTDQDNRTDIQSTDSRSYPWTTDCKKCFILFVNYEYQVKVSSLHSSGIKKGESRSNLKETGR